MDVSKYLEAEKISYCMHPPLEWLLLASNTIPDLNVSAILEASRKII